jgi:hypothetical protein
MKQQKRGTTSRRMLSNMTTYRCGFSLDVQHLSEKNSDGTWPDEHDLFDGSRRRSRISRGSRKGQSQSVLLR